MGAVHFGACAMAVAAKRSKFTRHWGPVLGAGAAGLVIGAGAIIAFGRDWAVQALAPSSLIGKVVPVTIAEAGCNSLFGKLAREEPSRPHAELASLET